jgi:hypothetical protein
MTFRLSPEVPDSGKRSRSAKARTGTARWRGLLLTVLLAGATGFSSLIPAGTAAASDGISRAASAAPSPTPLGGAKYAGSLILDDAGAQLKAWNQTAAECPVNPGYIGDGVVAAGSGGTIKLTTSSKRGSCVALVSPDAYSSGVIEARLYFPALPGKPGTIANWTSFWLTGQVWPDDGELDAVEVEPVDGRNAVTWHSGTASAPFVASTSGFFPARLPVQSANLTPGWHTVDVVYAKGFFAVYYDGGQYTSYTSSHIPGRPLNIHVTMTDTPDNSSVEQRIGGPPVNSDGSPATLTLKYLRVWSYR